MYVQQRLLAFKREGKGKGDEGESKGKSDKGQSKAKGKDKGGKGKGGGDNKFGGYCNGWGKWGIGADIAGPTPRKRRTPTCWRVVGRATMQRAWPRRSRPQ